MYQHNLLAKPCGINFAGPPIDLSKIKAPTFILSTHEDHIAPWKSTYAATRLYSGRVKFVLSTSGHMAGVISAPGSKCGHWANDNLPPSPDEWFAGATPHLGSWWPVWDEWATQLDSGRVPTSRSTASNCSGATTSSALPARRYIGSRRRERSIFCPSATKSPLASSLRRYSFSITSR